MSSQIPRPPNVSTASEAFARPVACGQRTLCLARRRRSCGAGDGKVVMDEAIDRSAVIGRSSPSREIMKMVEGDVS